MASGPQQQGTFISSRKLSSALTGGRNDPEISQIPENCAAKINVFQFKVQAKLAWLVENVSDIFSSAHQNGCGYLPLCQYTLIVLLEKSITGGILFLSHTCNKCKCCIDRYSMTNNSIRRSCKFQLCSGNEFLVAHVVCHVETHIEMTGLSQACHNLVTSMFTTYNLVTTL